MKVKLLRSAQKDLKKGSLFYEDSRIGLGAYFYKTLKEEIYSLEIFAGIHLQRGKLFRMKVKKFPYWVYYKY